MYKSHCFIAFRLLIVLCSSQQVLCTSKQLIIIEQPSKKPIFNEKATADLCEICRHGKVDLERVKAAIKNRANPNEYEPISRWTPLHWASVYGNTDIAKYLIANGADIESKDPHDMRPLHLACIFVQPDMVKLLVGKGADTEAKTYKDETSLARALENPSAPANPDRPALYEIAECLLSKNPKLATIASKTGETPLHKVCRRHFGYTKLALLLIEYKASVDAKNAKDKTPLQLASQKGDLEMLAKLQPFSKLNTRKSESQTQPDKSRRQSSKQ